MKEAKRYDVTEALALASLGNGTAEAMREALATTSEIPADRLADAVGELQQAIPVLKAHVIMLEAMQYGRPPTVAEVAASIAGASWIDDTKKQADWKITVSDEEGEEIASGTVRHKLD